jgi:hypothetical protein
MDYISGTDVWFSHMFIANGEPFIPDVGSVKYTVLDHSGAPIAGLADVAVTTDSTTFQIGLTIPAANNTVAAGKKFERRTIVIQYLRAGAANRAVKAYRLVPLLNHSVEPQHVRSFFGLQEKELPDAEIDLLAAYLYVEDDFTGVSLDSLLASGTTQELAANECIKLRAVIEVLPSVKQRMAQKETNGVVGFERPVVKDFDDIERKAMERYAAARVQALGLTDTVVSFILTTTDSDPITGA